MPDIAGYLFTQGILGVIALVLGFVVIKFYNKIERLEKEKYELSESRRLDSTETLKQVMAVLQDNSQNIAVLSEKIEVGKREGNRR